MFIIIFMRYWHEFHCMFEVGSLVAHALCQGLIYRNYKKCLGQPSCFSLDLACSELNQAIIKQVFVNSLGPSNAIWWQKTGSTLAQVKACCLMAPSHYLNQCWLIISEVQWHIRAISLEMSQPSITEICLKITCLKCHSNFPGANELMDVGLLSMAVLWNDDDNGRIRLSVSTASRTYELAEETHVTPFHAYRFH